MVQENNINLIIVCGPTASGKTALSVEIAKLLETEIIYADSMDIYKGLDIGTAKPTIEEMGGIKHHLIDVVEPTDSFTVFDYREKAKPIIDNLIQNGKIPVICGGTGFYINSILYNLSYGQGTGDLKVREKYKDLAEKYGNEYVYNILKEVDSVSAEKLHYNDLKRVIRALEIYETGVKKSDIVDEKTPNYNYIAVYIDFERAELYDRINKRVDIMFENGLLDEIKMLLDKGITKDCQCMQGIGYKEVLSFIDGDMDLDSVKEQIKINTRHYAKRQLTFFKGLPNLLALKKDDPKNLAKFVVEKVWLT